MYKILFASALLLHKRRQKIKQTSTIMTMERFSLTQHNNIVPMDHYDLHIGETISLVYRQFRNRRADMTCFPLSRLSTQLIPGFNSKSDVFL
jgi:hypothetical protein